MKARRYRVTFRPQDMACTPPCGMDAALNSLDELIRSILSRDADDAREGNLRFGHSDVDIKNSIVTIHPCKEADAEKVIALSQFALPALPDQPLLSARRLSSVHHRRAVLSLWFQGLGPRYVST